MYEFHSLENRSFEEISACFNQAFSDYPIPLHLTADALKMVLEKSRTDRKASCGAFFQGELIGFIFHSSGFYRGCSAAFDVGTGIVPSHRGKGVFSRLLEYSLQNLRQSGIEKYFLEVLQENERAVSVYMKKGFRITRSFSVLKAPDPSPFPHAEAKDLKNADLPEFEQKNIRGCLIPEPSFEHSPDILHAHPELYRVLFAEREDRVSAFCIFTADSGDIVSMGWSGPDDFQAAVTQLVVRFPGLTIKNVDMRAAETLSLLRKLGFTEAARQYEMERSLL